MSVDMLQNQCGRRVDVSRANFFLSIDVKLINVLTVSLKNVNDKLPCGRMPMNIGGAHRLFSRFPKKT